MPFRDPDPHKACSPWASKNMNPLDRAEREFERHVPPNPVPPPERSISRPYTEADRLADLAAIRAGLRPFPATLTQHRGRAVQFLMKLCSASGRAVAVFALCFAAATLALRLERVPVPAPCAASPSAAPIGTTGAYEHLRIRP